MFLAESNRWMNHSTLCLSRQKFPLGNISKTKMFLRTESSSKGYVPHENWVKGGIRSCLEPTRTPCTSPSRRKACEYSAFTTDTWRRRSDRCQTSSSFLLVEKHNVFQHLFRRRAFVFFHFQNYNRSRLRRRSQKQNLEWFLGDMPWSIVGFKQKQSIKNKIHEGPRVRKRTTPKVWTALSWRGDHGYMQTFYRWIPLRADLGSA